MTIKKVMVGDIVGGIPIHQTFQTNDTLSSPEGQVLPTGTPTTGNVYANETARLAATGFLPADIGKVYRQSSDNTFWILTDDDPITWQLAGGTGQFSSFIYTNATARTNVANTYTDADIGKVARQLDDDSLWLLTSVSPSVVWTKINVTDALTLTGLSPSASGTANTIVKRDSNGDFSVNVVTGTLNGTAYKIRTSAPASPVDGDIWIV